MAPLTFAERNAPARRSVSFVFPAEAASVGAARRALRDALIGWDLEPLVERAALLTSELATNAVLHAHTGLLLHVTVGQERLRVTVADQNPTLPRRRKHGLHAGTGRGLALVEALSADHGVQAPYLDHAKGVWFELPVDAAESAPVEEGAIYGQDWLALLAQL